MKIIMMKCNHEPLPDYVEIDSQIKDAQSYIYAMKPDLSGCIGYYAYQHWLPGKCKFQLSPQICGVSECELSIFIERTKSFHEFATYDEICGKYPHMTQERVRGFTLSSLKQMHLAPQKEEILRQLLEGKTKSEMIHSGYVSLAEINDCLTSYKQRIDYSCNFEYEKKIVKEAAEYFDKGQVEFLYTPEIFAEKYGIPLLLMNEIQTNILDNQSCLSASDTEHLRKLLNISDYGILSDVDKAFMQEMREKLVHFYRMEEDKYYCKQIEAVCQNGEVNEDELRKLAINNCLNYFKLRKTCQSMSVSIKRKPTTLKSVADFLE